MEMSENWVVWFNGEIIPETEARVPFRDRGFKYGDAAFDQSIRCHKTIGFMR